MFKQISEMINECQKRRVDSWCCRLAQRERHWPLSEGDDFWIQQCSWAPGKCAGTVSGPHVALSAGWRMPLVPWQLEDRAEGVCFCSFSDKTEGG